MKERHSLNLSLGGINLLLESEEREIIDLSQEAFKEFLGQENKPEIKINIILDKELQNIHPYAYGNPHRTGVIRESNKIFARGSLYRGIFDLKKNEAEIRQGCSLAPLYLFLRFVLSVYLPLTEKGFLLHSTSVVKDGLCFLFSGPPQSGKSTIARLSDNYKILSDDFSIIRKTNSVFSCFGSPFWGHLEIKGENIKNIPIKGLYFLKQDDESYSRKLNKQEAMRRLIQNISVIAKDLEINRKIIKLADEFTDKIKVNILHFRLENTFWRKIR